MKDNSNVPGKITEKKNENKKSFNKNKGILIGVEFLPLIVNEN